MALDQVPEFSELTRSLEKNFSINGKASSTLNNYLRCLAHLAIYYKCSPELLTEEQINDYLFHCQNLHACAEHGRSKTPSESFFKHTIYGLRAAYKVLGMDKKRIQLPQIERQKDLPIVLNKKEVRELLNAPKYLKHRLMLALLYGCGLRSYELCNLLQSDVDFERKMVFIRKQKGKTDRYVPLSVHLIRGLKKYYETERPIKYVFNSQVTKDDFLFSVKAMSDKYRGRFTAKLRKALPQLPQSLYDDLYKQKWVVYAKPPFGKPEHMIEYLGRYTHKIAISNHRVLNLDQQNRTVTFSLKDYKKGGNKIILTLSSKEFIRRFQLHILPKGFTRIRHYGFLSSSWKKEKLPQLQLQLADKDLVYIETIVTQEKSLHRMCPSCRKGRLITLLTFDSRGPPKNYKELTQRILLKYNTKKNSSTWD